MTYISILVLQFLCRFKFDLKICVGICGKANKRCKATKLSFLQLSVFTAHRDLELFSATECGTSDEKLQIEFMLII